MGCADPRPVRGVLRRREVLQPRCPWGIPLEVREPNAILLLSFGADEGKASEVRGGGGLSSVRSVKFHFTLLRTGTSCSMGPDTDLPTPKYRPHPRPPIQGRTGPAPAAFRRPAGGYVKISHGSGITRRRRVF
ncbi:hypothetical protein KM043_018015 [Ampulex compressa]|nr:hypothetical protein KM043_018015 [Ampulex compressa]